MAKKPAEPKQPKLLDELLTIQGQPNVPKWQSKLTSEQLAQLEEIKEAVKQGTVTLSLTKINELICARWGVTVTKTVFRDWMRA